MSVKNLAPPRSDAELLVALHSKYVALPNECWIWTGYRGKGGYGKIFWNGRRHHAHRVHWELVNGPIPAGMQLDHLCRERLCIHIRHLEPVSPRENTLRGIGITARRAAQTHCFRGHELTPDNLMPSKSGNRACWECYHYKCYSVARETGKVPFRIRGHTIKQVEPGRWCCACGKFLATERRKALAAQHPHRAEVWAAMCENWTEFA